MFEDLENFWKILSQKQCWHMAFLRAIFDKCGYFLRYFNTKNYKKVSQEPKRDSKITFKKSTHLFVFEFHLKFLSEIGYFFKNLLNLNILTESNIKNIIDDFFSIQLKGVLHWSWVAELLRFLIDGHVAELTIFFNRWWTYFSWRISGRRMQIWVAVKRAQAIWN